MKTGSKQDAGSGAAASPRGVALPLLAAAMVMLTILTVPRAPLDLDVDADTSLSEVLSHAHQHGLQFGTDLVFTYGPLGYLNFFYYSPYAAGTRLVVSAILCFTVAAGLCLVAWRLRLWWGCALVGAFMFAVVNIVPKTDLVMHTGLLCWGLLCFVESGRRLIMSVVAFAALAVFGGLAKTSGLFLAVPSVVLLGCDLLARGEPRLGVSLVAGFSAAFVVGWMAAGQSLSHLGAHLGKALAVAQGYNQALGWEALPQVTYSGFVVMLLAVSFVVIRTLTWSAGTRSTASPGSPLESGTRWKSSQPASSQRTGLRRALLFAWLCSVLFLIWKHGFVRADSFHLFDFFGFTPALALALEVLPSERRTARLWARALGVGGCLVPLFTLQALFFASGWKSLVEPIRAFGYHARCLLKPGEYERRMNEVIEENRSRTSLPVLREIVGRSSVDVFGQEQIYALLNGMNYRPRPVFHSYAACSARLMRLNEEFYLSSSAPEYVMFLLGATDRKFPPLEDAMLLRDLLINYRPVGAEHFFLLLKRNSSRSPRLKLLREGSVRPGERIDLTNSGPADLWLEIGLEPTLVGRLRQFFCRPPPVRLAAWRGEGPKDLLARRRAPAAMLAAGFVASPLLMGNQDVADWYNGRPRVRPCGYSVELLPREERFWQSAIHFRVLEITAEGSTHPREP